MTTLNIVNPTGTKRNWSINLDGEVLASGITTWTGAVKMAQKMAELYDPTAILLHKINGTVTPVGAKSRAKTPVIKAASVPVIDPENTVYITRVQKSIDDDSKDDRVSNTLNDAVRALPRFAREFNWTAVERNGYDAHTGPNGVIVSIEKTTN